MTALSLPPTPRALRVVWTAREQLALCLAAAFVLVFLSAWAAFGIANLVTAVFGTDTVARVDHKFQLLAGKTDWNYKFACVSEWQGRQSEDNLDASEAEFKATAIGSTVPVRVYPVGPFLCVLDHRPNRYLPLDPDTLQSLDSSTKVELALVVALSLGLSGYVLLTVPRAIVTRLVSSWTQRQLVRDGCACAGHVCEKRAGDRVTYTFLGPRGEERTGCMTLPKSAPACEPGREITVLYQRDNPSRSTVYEFCDWELVGPPA